MNHKDDIVSEDPNSSVGREVREERRSMSSQEPGAEARRGAATPPLYASTRREVDDSDGAEELHDSTQQPSPPPHHQDTTVPGAEAVPGPDHSAHQDDGTVTYSTATETELPVPSMIVDTEEDNRMLTAQNELLREQNRILRERQQIIQGENVAVGHVVATGTVGAPELENLEAQVPTTVVDDQNHTDENELGIGGRVLEKLGISCDCSIGCRRVALVAAFLALLIVAIVVPVVLTQRSGPMPPTPRQELGDFLSSISPDGGDALSSPGTPQNQALGWLAGNSDLDSYSDDKKQQRYALAVFYYSTEGDSWTNRTNWFDDGEECERWWQDDGGGVDPSTLQCTDSGAVEELDLDNNTLQGTIPPEINLFSESLEILTLDSNSISGPIPSEIGQLTGLASIALWSNQLTGTIPSSLASLTNLERLYLFDNLLSGMIPSSFASLTDLERLRFENNTLTGMIPTSFAGLTNLDTLRLDDNELTGTIPTFFANMTNLDTLRLEGNRFTGTFSCPEFISDCRVSCDDSRNEQCRSL